MSSRAEQKEKRRQEILEAGLDLFIRRGFAATKIADIAKQVKMSTGLLFHYFESKEQLYETLIGIGISGPQAFMPGSEAEPISFFENAAEQILHYVKKEPFVAKMFVLMSQATCNEAVSPAIQELLAQADIVTPSIHLIEEGQRNNTIKEGNPHALAIAFWASINGVAETLAMRPDSPCPQPDWIVDILRRKPE